MSDPHDIPKQPDRPSVERRREVLEREKANYREHLERTGKPVDSRAIDREMNQMAERHDREKGWD